MTPLMMLHQTASTPRVAQISTWSSLSPQGSCEELRNFLSVLGLWKTSQQLILHRNWWAEPLPFRKNDFDPLFFAFRFVPTHSLDSINFTLGGDGSVLIVEPLARRNLILFTVSKPSFFVPFHCISFCILNLLLSPSIRVRVSARRTRRNKFMYVYHVQRSGILLLECLFR